MTKQERNLMEQWFEDLQVRIVVLGAEVSLIHAEMEGLKKTLAGMRSEPKMSADEIFDLWKAEAEKFEALQQRIAPSIFENALKEQKKAKKG